MTTAQSIIVKRLRGELRHGDISLVAARVGMTRQYVGRCLNPTSGVYNQGIVDEALRLIQERKLRDEAVLNQLNSQAQ